MEAIAQEIMRAPVAVPTPLRHISARTRRYVRKSWGVGRFGGKVRGVCDELGIRLRPKNLYRCDRAHCARELAPISFRSGNLRGAVWTAVELCTERLCRSIIPAQPVRRTHGAVL